VKLITFIHGVDDYRTVHYVLTVSMRRRVLAQPSYFMLTRVIVYETVTQVTLLAFHILRHLKFSNTFLVLVTFMPTAAVLHGMQ
jgi:hypothetical protein